jgi:transcriptional regulator with XRE-family HTH domain
VKVAGETPMEQLAEALRLLRVFHDISQTELADRLQISKSFLSEIESGKKEPTLQLLSRYATEFEISISSLLFFAEGVAGTASRDTGRRFAPKILKLLDWIAAAKEPSQAVERKPAKREGSTARKQRRFGG